MNNKHQVHNLIILDESGSMESIKQTVIEGFNEIVQTTKGIEIRFPEQAHFISLVSFNGAGRKKLLWKEPVTNLQQIDATTYQPQESTPLFDAMGDSINNLKNELMNINEHNVLVTIFTDGEENASKEYNAAQIKRLIEELKTRNWTFTYIGTDHDVDSFAVSISINNTMMFKKDNVSMKKMFLKESEARLNYSKKINAKIDATEDFYKDDQEKS